MFQWHSLVKAIHGIAGDEVLECLETSKPIGDQNMAGLKSIRWWSLAGPILIMSSASVLAASGASIPVPAKREGMTVVAQSKECKVSGEIATVKATADGNCICPAGTLRAGERPLGPLGSGKYVCSPIW